MIVSKGLIEFVLGKGVRRVGESDGRTISYWSIGGYYSEIGVYSFAEKWKNTIAYRGYQVRDRIEDGSEHVTVQMDGTIVVATESTAGVCAEIEAAELMMERI